MTHLSLPVLLALASGAPAMAQTNQPSWGSYLNRTAVTVSGYHRDFQMRTEPGGHVDFGLLAADGMGRYIDVVADELDENKKPVFRSTGRKLIEDWRDGLTRSIMPPRSHITSMPDDIPGSAHTAPGGAVTSSSSFQSWFRDVSSLNRTTRIPITLSFDEEASAFVFDGSLDELTRTKDFGYSYELDLVFIHEEQLNRYLSIESNADAWAFIDGRLAIDIGAASGEWRPWTFTGGFAADGQITLGQDAIVDVAPGSSGAVSTNQISDGIVTLGQTAVIDADVNIGPGGNTSTGINLADGSNITGSTGTLNEPIPMPNIQAPDLGPATGNLRIDGHETIRTNQHVRAMTVNGRLRIDGDITILCDSDFTVMSDAEIQLTPGSRLQLYSAARITFFHRAKVNTDERDPSRVIFYSLGNDRVTVYQYAEIFGCFVAPYARLDMYQGSHIHGSFIGQSADLSQGARFTIIDVNLGGPGSGWGTNVGAPAQAQRIDLNRLDLTNGRTHALRIFFANRRGTPSRLRIETNIATLRLAAPPETAWVD